MPTSRFKPVAEEIAQLYGLSAVEYFAHGAFKETYRAEADGSDYYAIKIMDPSKCHPCRTEREIDAVKRCDSPYIARLLEHGIHHHGGTDFLFVIETFFFGGTLTQRCQSSVIIPDNVRTFANPLVEAIAHLKENDLVHRDIKPDNIMFEGEDGPPILVDFGLVRDLTLTSVTQTCLPQGPCTPLFAAPEQLNNDKGMIDWRTDQFGLAATLAHFLIGRHPYQGTGKSIGYAIDSVRSRRKYSDEFKQFAEANDLTFLIKMLEPWPHHRFNSIEKLREAL